MRTRWYISSCINEMELAEKSTINLLEAMYSDIPLTAKIITYAILRDKEHLENTDSEKFQEVYQNVMDVSNPQEYMDAITTIIRMMDIEWFFYSRNSQKYKYSAKQGWIPRKNKRDSKRSRIYPATCDYGDIAGMIEDFQGCFNI